MLRIDRAAVDALTRANDAADLVHLVEQAVRLEFATIPPYLTAMLSLRPGRNRDIWWALHDVVVDEMLHMLIGANLLNALGGRPGIDDPSFTVSYPGPLPLGVGTSLVVGLRPFSLELVESTFMAIEEPEHPIDLDAGSALAAPLPRDFATIGEFYRTLSGALGELGDPLPGDRTRQVVAPRWFPTTRLFPIVDVASATRALELVAEEGEGTATSPIDPDGDVAHYYRFESIRRGARLVTDPSAPSGYSFTGDPYRFDPDGVWPLTTDQRQAALDPRGEAWRRVQQFRVTLGRLLAALQRSVDGDPAHLDVAMGVMFELKIAGQILAATPVEDGRSGLHVGPVFVPADGNA